MVSAGELQGMNIREAQLGAEIIGVQEALQATAGYAEGWRTNPQATAAEYRRLQDRLKVLEDAKREFSATIARAYAVAAEEGKQAEERKARDAANPLTQAEIERYARSLLIGEAFKKQETAPARPDASTLSPLEPTLSELAGRRSLMNASDRRLFEEEEYQTPYIGQETGISTVGGEYRIPIRPGFVTSITEGGLVLEPAGPAESKLEPASLSYAVQSNPRGGFNYSKELMKKGERAYPQALAAGVPEIFLSEINARVARDEAKEARYRSFVEKNAFMTTLSSRLLSRSERGGPTGASLPIINEVFVEAPALIAGSIGSSVKESIRGVGEIVQGKEAGEFRIRRVGEGIASVGWNILPVAAASHAAPLVAAVSLPVLVGYGAKKASDEGKLKEYVREAGAYGLAFGLRGELAKMIESPLKLVSRGTRVYIEPEVLSSGKVDIFKGILGEGTIRGSTNLRSVEVRPMTGKTLAAMIREPSTDKIGEFAISGFRTFRQSPTLLGMALGVGEKTELIPIKAVIEAIKAPKVSTIGAEGLKKPLGDGTFILKKTSAGWSVEIPEVVLYRARGTIGKKAFDLTYSGFEVSNRVKGGGRRPSFIESGYVIDAEGGRSGGAIRIPEKFTIKKAPPSMSRPKTELKVKEPAIEGVRFDSVKWKSSGDAFKATKENGGAVLTAEGKGSSKMLLVSKRAAGAAPRIKSESASLEKIRVKIPAPKVGAVETRAISTKSLSGGMASQRKMVEFRPSFFSEKTRASSSASGQKRMVEFRPSFYSESLRASSSRVRNAEVARSADMLRTSQFSALRMGNLRITGSAIRTAQAEAVRPAPMRAMPAPAITPPKVPEIRPPGKGGGDKEKGRKLSLRPSFLRVRVGKVPTPAKSFKLRMPRVKLRL